MLKNYVKIAWRNLQHQKALSFINISGLSIGLACFTVFLLFALYEFSFDDFHQNKQSIYRLAEWYHGFPGREPNGEAYGGVPGGPAMKSDLPDIEKYARIQTGFAENLVSVNNEVSKSKISFADPDLFSIFSFKFLSGTGDVLKDPRQVILTKEKAIQLFGRTDITGQTIRIKMDSVFEPFLVGGVTESIPSNSSIQFSIAGSFAYLLNTGMGKDARTNWNMTIGCETYLQLRNGSKLPAQTAALSAFRKKYYPDEETELIKRKQWDGKSAYPVNFILQPLLDIHTNPIIYGMSSGMDPKYIWLLVAIASGILIIACINFTTLAVGRSAGRAREVGVRKVIGGQRKQLIFQFLTESILLSIFSAGIAFILTSLILPFFNSIAGTDLHFSFSQYPQMVWLLAGLTLLTGILAGIYPALVLAGFRPIEVLKNKIKLGGSNIFTRSLVTVQFILSITLIISTIIILQQIKYMQSKDLGFNRENVVSIDLTGSDASHLFPLIKQSFKSIPGIAGSTASEMGLGAGTGLMGTGFEYKGETKGVIMYPVDVDYLHVMGIQLISGRNFDPSLTSDSTESIIVNESFLGDYQLTAQDALGKVFTEKQFRDQVVHRRIIGVAKNFNYSKLSEKIRPQMFFQPAKLDARKLFVRLKAGNPAATLDAIAKTMHTLVPDLPFQYSFLDEDFSRFYEVETKIGKISGAAGAICIFLACLGLFGLAALAAANRTKEIGIRKVLGASVASIVQMISGSFIKLILLAILISTPIAWLMMNKFLQSYQYRISVSWMVFALTGVSALIVALLTIGIQAVKAGIANPVNSLRSE